MVVALGCIWGGSFTLIKLGVETIPPVTLTFTRMLIGAAILGAICAIQRTPWPRGRGVWLVMLGVALAGNVVPQVLISWGETRIDASLAAILMAMMPIGALVIAHLLTTDERLSVRRVCGVVLGFGAVLVLVGRDALAGMGGAVIAQLAVAFGAMSYAYSAVLSRRLAGVPLLSLGTATLTLGAVVQLPVMLAFEAPWRLEPSTTSMLAAAGLGVVSTGVATLLYFAVITRAGATVLAMSNYLVPLVGVLIGAVFLGEAISYAAIVALAMVMAGVWLIRTRA